ncbi:5-methyl-dCTP pyrophosphohydrolase [hydrothermal vent metagenome]|uniref:8-oxo-dGTP diphosphatase n=1 Tax=hydrothermal vent metagenome TaxID=652676 RepID=A0A3B0S8J1_9ZZZZ
MEKNPTYLFVVAAALIDHRSKILVQKRPAGRSMAGLWEFPGGKVEADETPETALVRELKEELGITVSRASMIPTVFASEPLEEKHLILLLYICRQWVGEPCSMEENQIQWVSIDEMRKLDMPPADGPLIDRLEKEI